MSEQAPDTFSFDTLLAGSETPQAPIHDNRSVRENKEVSGDTRRFEHLKQTLHWAVVWGVRIASFSMLLLFVFRVYHLAAHECCVWISPERLQKIDSLLFSGFVGAFIARYLNQAIPVSNTGRIK